MKYLVFPLLFLFVSCSFQNPFTKTSPESIVPESSTDGVQISGSGSSPATADHEVTSVVTDDGTATGSGTGNISAEGTGTEASPGSPDSTMTTIGTGVKIQIKEDDALEKDPEIRAIEKDLDSIFSDIEKGGE